MLKSCVTKVPCVENYKYVVEAQDTLLNKTIVKANNFKPLEEFNYKFSKFKLMDDTELEKARQFLMEQKTFLEEKGKEIVSPSQSATRE
jgi:hypothetical protein